MIMISSKQKLIEFFRTFTNRLESTQLDEGLFDINISVIPINKTNMDVIGSSLKSAIDTLDSKVVPINGGFKK